jgi:hypothetical protein
MSKYELKSQCRIIRLDSVKRQQRFKYGYEDLLGKVEWFLVFETQAQYLVIGKIDGAVFVYVEFVPPPPLSFLEVQLHLELVLWRPDTRFK